MSEEIELKMVTVDCKCKFCGKPITIEMPVIATVDPDQYLTLRFASGTLVKAKPRGCSQKKKIPIVSS